jgi:putative phosphoribosyl transferase
MTFLSREEAGAELARHLLGERVRADLALGLPRGGVVVAAEVAHALHVPLDVIVVRKIGHPRYREYAVGALAEGDVVVLDDEAIERSGVLRAELQLVIAEEKRQLNENVRKFRLRPAPALEDRIVLLIDDGLATGATMEAAALSARKRAARKVIVAVPVASDNAVARLERVADAVHALLVDPAFDAVGRYYKHFSQTTDEEVVEALGAGVE